MVTGDKNIFHHKSYQQKNNNLTLIILKDK